MLQNSYIEKCACDLCPSQWSLVVATITEIPPVLFLPNFLVQRKVLKPLRTQTGGTIMVGFSFAEKCKYSIDQLN